MVQGSQEGRGGDAAFDSVDEVLEFAIGQERRAAAFYRGFAAQATHPGVARMCREMAAEEDRHEAVLRDLAAGLPSDLARDRVTDLKISDYLRDFRLEDGADQQDLLVAAMKSEARAELLYRDLAARCTRPAVAEVLLRLAAEEGAHKDAFEKQYDDRILDQN